MIDPVSRYYVLHEQAHPGYGAPPGFDSAVLRQLATEIRKECAEWCETFQGQAGDDYARHILARTKDK